jgi:hypothetical protein
VGACAGAVGAAGAAVAAGAGAPEVPVPGVFVSTDDTDVMGVTVMPVTFPFTLFFCFVDDVGIGRRGDPAPRYRLRSG